MHNSPNRARLVDTLCSPLHRAISIVTSEVLGMVRRATAGCGGVCVGSTPHRSTPRRSTPKYARSTPHRSSPNSKSCFQRTRTSSQTTPPFSKPKFFAARNRVGPVTFSLLLAANLPKNLLC